MDIKRLTKLAQTSTAVSTVKEAIDDVIQLAFNLVSNPAFVQMGFSSPFDMWVDDSLVIELSRYKRDLDAWQEIQSITMDYMHQVKDSKPFTDVISTHYADKGLSKALGQHLTPPSVAQGLIRFVNPEHDERDSKLARGESILVSEICSGAGTLLLSLLQDLYSKHPTSMHLVQAVAMDKDPNMVKLTITQVMLSSLFHGIPLGLLEVHFGDVITEYQGQGKSTLAYLYRNHCSNR